MTHAAKRPLGTMSEGRGRLPAPTECQHSRRKVLINNSLLFFRRASLPSLAIIKVLVAETIQTEVWARESRGEKMLAVMTLNCL